MLFFPSSSLPTHLSGFRARDSAPHGAAFTLIKRKRGLRGGGHRGRCAAEVVVLLAGRALAAMPREVLGERTAMDALKARAVAAKGDGLAAQIQTLQAAGEAQEAAEGARTAARAARQDLEATKKEATAPRHGIFGKEMKGNRGFSIIFAHVCGVLEVLGSKTSIFYGFLSVEKSANGVEALLRAAEEAEELAKSVRSVETGQRDVVSEATHSVELGSSAQNRWRFGLKVLEIGGR